MNREQQEMALWREAYEFAMSQTWDYAKAEEAASAAIEAFRKRYPVEPAKPPAVWYDEPPFPKDGSASPVWIVDCPFPVLVAYCGGGWAYEVPGRSNRWHPLAGRRVYPITKPQEPTK